MRGRNAGLTWRPVVAGLMALMIVTGPARAQQGSTSSSSKEGEPVVRTFGTEGGYRTEVRTESKGKMTAENQRQVSVLTAEVFEHITRARDALDADDTKVALKEVNKARQAIKAIRSMLPKTIVRTRTLGPDGKVVYEDERESQPTRIPLYEGMIHTDTLAPILAARRNALQIAGVRVVEAESIVTEVTADVDVIESQLARAAKALENNKSETASNALNAALVRGLETRFTKEDSDLAYARDAIWLARRALEENNPTQALVNLESARQRLRIYREVVSAEHRPEVDQLLQEITQLEGQLRLEPRQPVSRAERARQGGLLTHWWDRVNSWFRRHL